MSAAMCARTRWNDGERANREKKSSAISSIVAVAHKLENCGGDCAVFRLQLGEQKKKHEMAKLWLAAPRFVCTLPF